MVIGIIAILASLLLPALKSAKDTARSVSCLSNQKQLGILLCGYTDSYISYFPYISRSNSLVSPMNWNGFEMWFLGLLNYYSGRELTLDSLKTNKLMRCPDWEQANPAWAVNKGIQSLSCDALSSLSAQERMLSGSLMTRIILRAMQEIMFSCSPPKKKRLYSFHRNTIA